MKSFSLFYKEVEGNEKSTNLTNKVIRIEGGGEGWGRSRVGNMEWGRGRIYERRTKNCSGVC